jgi:hypothetical protein
MRVEQPAKKDLQARERFGIMVLSPRVFVRKSDEQDQFAKLAAKALADFNDGRTKKTGFDNPFMIITKA